MLGGLFRSHKAMHVQTYVHRRGEALYGIGLLVVLCACLGRSVATVRKKVSED